MSEISPGSHTDQESEDEEEEPENHSNDHQRSKSFLLLPLLLPLAPTPGQVGVAVGEELEEGEAVGEEKKCEDSHQVARVKQPHPLRTRVLVGIGHNDVSKIIKIIYIFFYFYKSISRYATLSPQNISSKTLQKIFQPASVQ